MDHPFEILQISPAVELAITTLGVVGTIVAIVVGIQTIRQRTPYRRISEAQRFEVARQALDADSMQFRQDLHPYAKRIASRVLARSSRVSENEIGNLLSFPRGMHCVDSFDLAKDMFTSWDEHPVHALRFRGIYAHKLIRQLIKSIAVILYWVCGIIAFFPLILPGIVRWAFRLQLLEGSESEFDVLVRFAITTFVFVFPVFGFLAWKSIKYYGKILRAEELDKAVNLELAR